MTKTPFSRHALVATPEGGARFTLRVREHLVQTDQPERAGGSDTAPTPLELLGASLAGCVALYVHKYCESQSLDASELAVEVKPFWRENPGRVGRYDVVVHLPQSIPAEYHAAIEAVAQSCPVHHTLTHAPEITVQLKEVAAAGAGVG
jgi:putative redox protein